MSRTVFPMKREHIFFFPLPPNKDLLEIYFHGFFLNVPRKNNSRSKKVDRFASNIFTLNYPPPPQNAVFIFGSNVDRRLAYRVSMAK